MVLPDNDISLLSFANEQIEVSFFMRLSSYWWNLMS